MTRNPCVTRIPHVHTCGVTLRSRHWGCTEPGVRSRRGRQIGGRGAAARPSDAGATRSEVLVARSQGKGKQVIIHGLREHPTDAG